MKEEPSDEHKQLFKGIKRKPGLIYKAVPMNGAGCILKSQNLGRRRHGVTGRRRYDTHL